MYNIDGENLFRGNIMRANEIYCTGGENNIMFSGSFENAIRTKNFIKGEFGKSGNIERKEFLRKNATLLKEDAILLKIGGGGTASYFVDIDNIKSFLTMAKIYKITRNFSAFPVGNNLILGTSIMPKYLFVDEKNIESLEMKGQFSVHTLKKIRKNL